MFFVWVDLIFLWELVCIFIKCLIFLVLLVKVFNIVLFLDKVLEYIWVKVKVLYLLFIILKVKVCKGFFGLM